MCFVSFFFSPRYSKATSREITLFSINSGLHWKHVTFVYIRSHGTAIFLWEWSCTAVGLVSVFSPTLMTFSLLRDKLKPKISSPQAEERLFYLLLWFEESILIISSENFGRDILEWLCWNLCLLWLRESFSAFLLSASSVPYDFLFLLCVQAHCATDQWDCSLAALKITWYQPHLIGMWTTLLTWLGFTTVAGVVSWGPGPQNTTIGTSSCRSTLVERLK